MTSMNIFTQMNAIKLTPDGHTSTALQIGLPANLPSGKIQQRFDLYLAGYGGECSPASLIYRLDGNNYRSELFDRARADIVIPFIHHCGTESLMADHFYGHSDVAEISDLLTEYTNTIMSESRPPPILSTFKNFVPRNQLGKPKDFLCHSLDKESLASYNLGEFGTSLARNLKSVSCIYPTHFVALYSSIYNKRIETEDKKPDTQIMIRPQRDHYREEGGKKHPSNGWSIFMLQQDGTRNGGCYMISFDTSFRKTMNRLSALEEAFITPRMTHHAFALNAQCMTAHYGRYNEKLEMYDAAFSPSLPKRNTQYSQN
jgi:hypothetical protein